MLQHPNDTVQLVAVEVARGVLCQAPESLLVPQPRCGLPTDAAIGAVCVILLVR